MFALVLALPALALAVTAVLLFLSVRLPAGSAERLRARQAEQPLAHELPYWAFLDAGDTGVTVGVDLTHSAFLELEGIDTDCLDAESLNQLSHALHGVLQGLPAHTTLQCLYWTDGDVSGVIDAYRAQADHAQPLGRILVEEKAALLLRARGLRRSRLVLGISLPAHQDDQPGRQFLQRFLPAARGRLTQAQHEEALKQLHVVVDQVTRGLASTGLEVKQLSAADIRGLVYSFLNPAHSRAVPEPPRAPICDEQTAREQLVLAGIVEERDTLICDGQLIRVLTLKSLPTWTEPALLEGLLVQLPFHCHVQVAIEAFDPLKALDDLKRRRDQAHLLATLRERRNQEAEAQEQDVAELIDKNLRSSVRMVRLAATVLLSVDAQTPDARLVLDNQTQEVKRLAGGLHGAQVMVDEFAQLDEYLATLPGNAKHGRRWRRCTSENAAHLVLAWKPWGGAAQPSLLVQNGRGHLVGLDPFDEHLDNPNAFMAGSSGSGKSATTNYLLLNLLSTGSKALIVDVGGSYRRLIEIFGGHYFALTLDQHVDQALNPFFAHDDIAGPSGRLDERRMAFILAVLERMVCDARRPELGNAERAVLNTAVEETYRATGHRTPILSDLVTVLRTFRHADPEDAAISQAFARDLRVWTEGPAARLLNRPSTVSLTTELAAFDLKGLEANPALQAIVMLILSGIIWHLVMRDPTSRKIVVFDEVWRLLESPSSARLLAELYRTSRKYRASILTISQSVEDFTGSSIATALVNNSATTYLLKHRRGHEIVAQQFHLNPREEYVFRSLEMRRGQYTEALILHGERHHFLARIVLSPLEYWITTSHPADQKLERELHTAQPHLSRLDQLRLLAARYPHGAMSVENDPDSEAADAA